MKKYIDRTKLELSLKNVNDHQKTAKIDTFSLVPRAARKLTPKILI